jgi:hypothetical protein
MFMLQDIGIDVATWKRKKFHWGANRNFESLIRPEQTEIFHILSSDKFYKTVWDYLYLVYNIFKIFLLGFLEF